VAAPFSRFLGCINKQLLMIAHKLTVRGNQSSTKLNFFLVQINLRESIECAEEINAEAEE